MGRHFHWQVSECEDMPVDELIAYYKDAVAMLDAEASARRKAALGIT